MVDIYPIPARAKQQPHFIDLTGLQFGRWTVIGYAGKRGRNAFWACTCSCGTTKAVDAKSLRLGKSANCGCVRSETLAAMKTTHGHGSLPEYRCWFNMIRRCYNPKCKAFRDYGARGISVCDQWRKSFDTFFADMGLRPSPMHSIERKENDGNYCPANCCWATRVEQQNNTRRSKCLKVKRAAGQS